MKKVLVDDPHYPNMGRMVTQSEIDFSVTRARERRDEGIKQSEDSANDLHANWSDTAYDFLKGYIKINPVFQVEDVRFASQGIVKAPKSQRAWGAVILRAAREGLIWQDGFKKVKNVKAHRTPAALWKTIKGAYSGDEGAMMGQSY